MARSRINGGPRKYPATVGSELSGKNPQFYIEYYIKNTESQPQFRNYTPCHFDAFTDLTLFIDTWYILAYIKILSVNISQALSPINY